MLLKGRYEQFLIFYARGRSAKCFLPMADFLASATLASVRMVSVSEAHACFTAPLDFLQAALFCRVSQWSLGLTKTPEIKCACAYEAYVRGSFRRGLLWSVDRIWEEIHPNRVMYWLTRGRGDDSSLIALTRAADFWVLQWGGTSEALILSYKRKCVLSRMLFLEAARSSSSLCLLLVSA